MMPQLATGPSFMVSPKNGRRTFAAMLYFSPLFGAIGVAIGILTIFIIRKFDKPFIKSLREVNAKEHEVSSTLFDSLSNIVTVITLRLEKRIKVSFMNKLDDVAKPFKYNVKMIKIVFQENLLTLHLKP